MQLLNTVLLDIHLMDNSCMQPVGDFHTDALPYIKSSFTYLFFYLLIYLLTLLSNKCINLQRTTHIISVLNQLLLLKKISAYTKIC